MELFDGLIAVVLMLGALVVCVPILILTFLIAYGISMILAAIGVPGVIQGVVILVVGLGGGLILSFLALRWIIRRFSLMSVVSRGAAPDPGPLIGPDLAPDPATFAERLAAADARLAAPKALTPDQPHPMVASTPQPLPRQPARPADEGPTVFIAGMPVRGAPADFLVALIAYVAFAIMLPVMSLLLLNGDLRGLLWLPVMVIGGLFGAAWGYRRDPPTALGVGCGVLVVIVVFMAVVIVVGLSI